MVWNLIYYLLVVWKICAFCLMYFAHCVFFFCLSFLSCFLGWIYWVFCLALIFVSWCAFQLSSSSVMLKNWSSVFFWWLCALLFHFAQDTSISKVEVYLWECWLIFLVARSTGRLKLKIKIESLLALFSYWLFFSFELASFLIFSLSFVYLWVVFVLKAFGG